HDEKVGPLLADLDSRVRNQPRVVQDIEDQAHFYELRGPERPIGVRCNAAQLHGAGAGLDRVVDEIKSAGTGLDVVVLGVGDHFEVWIVEVSPNEWKVRFGDREVGIDRVHSHD